MPNGASLSPDDAEARIREVIEHAELRWSRHARQELAKDDLNISDARVRTARMVVVIAFVEGGLRGFVTAWRIKR